MNFVLSLHSVVRWAVVALFVIVIIKLIAIWLGKREFQQGDNVLMRIFTSVFDLQVLLGIITLILWITSGNQMIPRIYEHAGSNLIAAVLVHLTAKWKKSPGPLRARNTAIALIVAAILVAAAVTRLPQGWTPTGAF